MGDVASTRDTARDSELDAALTRFGFPSNSKGDPVERMVLSRADTDRTNDDVSPPPGSGSPLVIGRELGRGGMGLVNLAEQTTLGRQVAVKQLRREVRSREARDALLQEAWIAGALEHPNIVPIYQLDYDEEGEPLIVMKRIEGVPWSDYLCRPDSIPGLRDGADILEQHLQIFLQVCNAIHFAHSRKIVHRDLKPHNVMIGGFGEVYVLDWGLAVSLEADRADGRLPLARDSTGIAGTPAYMAPEMAVGNAQAIDERTDVYLLGAILHEIVTGRPRHQGADLRAVLQSAFHSSPIDYGDDVPDELAAICNRATHADPDQRFASAQKLGDAVREFIGHRSSIQLASETAARLAALEQLVSAGDSADQGAILDLSVECRFGFQQALRIWPGNVEARLGLERTLAATIDFEIRRDNVAAASALLAELPERAAAALGDAVADLERRLHRKRDELAALRQMEHEQDLNRGQRARSYAALSLAVGSFANLVLYVLLRRGVVEFSAASYLTYGIGSLVVMSAIVVVFWRPLMQNRTNRDIVYTVAATAGVVMVYRILAVAAGLSYPVSFALEYLFWGLGFMLVAILKEPKLMLGASLLLCGGAVGAFWPAHSLLAAFLAAFSAMGWMALVWWPRKQESRDRSSGWRTGT